MCGICGVWYFDPERAVDAALVRLMRDRLMHRGPDDAGIHCAGSLGLGFRWLKVIDTAGSRQPITNESRQVWLVCNGEIYNFQSLRTVLATRHEFTTHGDAEVIAHLYEDSGNACVHSLRGMFAFALWDAVSQQLMFAVDRLGKKPLYYWLDHEKVVFGSELKALLSYPGLGCEIDDEALDEYFSCGYINAPRTIYRRIRRLPAGHLLTVQSTGIARLEAYWQPTFAEPGDWDHRSSADLAEELCQLLTEAVKLRMTSDVPLGAFLSGGVDSSAVVALMRSLSDAPVKTFSVGFSETCYDERLYARETAAYCHAEHHTEVVTARRALDLLPKLVRHFDEPFADASMIPTYVVSQLARQQVTVALSGDGGDEVFAGYHHHLYAYRQQYFESIIPRLAQPSVARLAYIMPRAAKIKPYLAAMGKPPQRWLSNGFFSTSERAMLYDSHLDLSCSNVSRSQEMFRRAARLDGLSQLQYHDLMRYLPGDILVKVDRASMLTSLEVRSPLLDHEVFEFMARVRPRQRMGLTGGKALLKHALGGLLPPAVHRRRKQGFSIPQGEWLRGALQPLLCDTLMTASAPFNRGYVRSLIDEHLSGRVDHKDRLWALLCYALWVRG